jgi:large subunit ribosomal protein L10
MKKISEILKEKSDSKLKEDLKLNAGLFFIKYSGVSSANLTQLRRNLKNAGARMFVTKNNFISVALKTINIGKDIAEFVNGPVALIFVKDDPVAPSKVLTDFAKSNSAVELKGGYIKDRVIRLQDFKVIANIPSRQVLYQRVATSFNSPISKLAMSLNQILAKLAYALKAVSDKKK